MKRIVLIHTVRSVLAGFEPMLRSALPFEVRIDNLLDEYLASDPDEKGYVSKECRNKLHGHIMGAQSTQPDIIVVTCSAMSGSVTQISPFVNVPLLAIDSEMMREAVTGGSNITVMATALSSATTTANTLRAEAARQGKTVHISAFDNVAAFDALQAGNTEAHDRLVKQQAGTLETGDTIVLAQASMAHLESEIAAITGRKVLSSPRLCIARIRAMLTQ